MNTTDSTNSTSNSTVYDYPVYQTPALAIHGIQLALGGILFPATILLIIARRNYNPLRAYGPGFLIFLTLSCFLNVVYLNSFALVGPSAYPCWLDMLLQISTGYFYLVSVTGRVASLYFSFMSSFTKVRMSVATHGAELAVLKRKNRAYEWMASFKGIIVFTIIGVVLFCIHFGLALGVMIVPEFETSYIQKGCEFYRSPEALGAMLSAYSMTFITCTLFAIAMLIFTILFLRLRVRDNFGVMVGIGISYVLLITVTIVFALMQFGEAFGWAASPVFGFREFNYTVVMSSESFILLFFADTLFNATIPAIRTFFWKKETADKDHLEEVETFLTNESAKKLFTQYCIKELSVENIMFHDHAVEYLKKDESKRRSFGQEIYRKFLIYDAAVAVNVPGELKTPIEEALKSDETPPANLFEPMRKSVQLNCWDTFLRFKLTAPYLQYAAASKNMQSSGAVEMKEV